MQQLPQLLAVLTAAKWARRHRSSLRALVPASSCGYHTASAAARPPGRRAPSRPFIPPPADDDPALGCPVEYINLKGTSRDNPAVCKYTGNKYFSDDWVGGGAH